MPSTDSGPWLAGGRWRSRAIAAVAAALAAVGFAGCYLVMVRTAAGQAADVAVFRVVFGLVPAGWPAVAVAVFARAAVIVVLAGLTVVLGVAAMGRRAWGALATAVLTVASSLVLGVWLRDDLLVRPRFTDEAFPANSLPSTHAVAAAALVAAVLLLWPAPWPWWLANAAGVVLLLVAVGNIVSQAHRPSDVRRLVPPGGGRRRRRDGGGRSASPSPLASLRADQRAGRRVLPAAVLPDPRERRVVGPRVHRVDQRRERPTPLPRPPAAHPAVRARLLRPASPRDPGRAGRARPRLRRRGLRLLALLVRRRGPDPRPPVPRGARVGGARPRLLPRLGQPDVDRHLARRAGPRPQAAALPRTRRRPATLRRAAPRVHRRALPHRRRTAGVLRLPSGGAAERRRVRRAVAADGDGGRPAGSLPRRGDERPARPRTRLRRVDGRRLRRGRLHAAAGRGHAAQRAADAGAAQGHARRTRDLLLLRLRHGDVAHAARTSSRASTRTGTTRRVRDAAAWRSSGPLRRSSGGTSSTPSPRCATGPPTSGCSG